MFTRRWRTSWPRRTPGLRAGAAEEMSSVSSTGHGTRCRSLPDLRRLVLDGGEVAVLAMVEAVDPADPGVIGDPSPWRRSRARAGCWSTRCTPTRAVGASAVPDTLLSGAAGRSRAGGATSSWCAPHAAARHGPGPGPAAWTARTSRCGRGGVHRGGGERQCSERTTPAGRTGGPVRYGDNGGWRVRRARPCRRGESDGY
ncbi:hypothetical protein QJS66_01100 [Kocuria rhizophila]|nr:hypothetical protein QJS66_01100 [Kocuria rhizophila]